MGKPKKEARARYQGFSLRHGNDVKEINEDLTRNLLDGQVANVDEAILRLKNNPFGQIDIRDGQGGVVYFEGPKANKVIY